MADFSISATELTAPKGAGAEVVQPVVDNTAKPILGALEGIVDIFNKGLQNNAKQKAQERQNAIVGGYVRAETRINEAVATGQITAAEASARSRANFNQYAAGSPEYITEFEKAGKALRGFSEAGEVQQALADEKEIVKTRRDQAIKRGFTFLPGMSKQAEEAQMQAAEKAIAGEIQFRELAARNAEARSQGTYNQQVAENEAKQLTVKVVNEIGGSNIQAFQQFISTLSSQVSSGALTHDAAQILLSERFSNISGAIAAAEGTNPNLGASWRSVFNDLNALGVKAIDPKNKAEDYKSQFDLIVSKAKIAAVSQSPQALAALVANHFFPTSPYVALQSQAGATDVFNIISTTPSTSRTNTAPVVGNPSIEADVLRLARESLKDLQGGKIEKKDVASVQAQNTVGNLLKETGSLIDRGVDAVQLKGMASFLASPEYGQYIASNPVNAEANQAAKKVFQLTYEPVIIRGVQEKLEGFLYGQASFARGKQQKTPTTVASVVDVDFTGSGVTFKVKPTQGLDPVEARSQQQSVAELNMAAQGINQLIHIGAHMEGSTDYKKFWEDNRHILMPQLYQSPGLKVGDTKEGKNGTYQYIGGPELSKDSWKKIK